jgi:hypothetical protein
VAKKVIEMTLTKGKKTRVYASDAKWLREWKWCVSSCPARYGKKSYADKFYATRGEKKKDQKYVRVYMHRAIMERMLMDEGKTLLEAKQMMEGMVVDHGDGDGLNNCRDNLWLITQSENARRKRNTTQPAENTEEFNF